MFAHGDHELRTAAQNVADGLMSEEAIREFKQQLRAFSGNPLSGMNPSAPGPNRRDSPPLLEIFPAPSAAAPPPALLKFGVKSSLDKNSGTDALSEKRPINNERQYQAATFQLAHGQSVSCQTVQSELLGRGITSEEEQDQEGFPKYTVHNPYAWRAI
jgi:hypothetical protein